jgi:hypothetical protein
MAVYTKPGADVFAPQDNAGNARPVNNGDAQVWATEVERGIASAAVIVFIDGGWQTATAYERNQALTRNDVVYRCIADHTSGSTTEPGVGASWETVWEVMIGAIALEDGSVSLPKLQSIVEATVLGRAGGAGTGAPVALSGPDIGAIVGGDGEGGVGTLAERLTADVVRASAAVTMHSINLTDGRADQNGNDWIVSWSTCRAVIGSAQATINDLAATTLASNELLYIDVAGGSTPYTAVKATNSGGLRADFRDGKKLLLLFNWGGGLLVGAMADTLKTVASQGLLDALSAESDLIYIGSGNYGDLSVDPKGVIVQGINLATGLPIVTGGGGGGLLDPSLIIITRSANNLYIHFPQADGTYVRPRFTRLTNAGQNSDVWQVNGIDHASLSGGSSSTIQSVCDTGQVEIALSREGDEGSFFMGGNAHGNDEMLADPLMMVDGVAVDITTGTETITCKLLEIFQASNLLSPDDPLTVVAKRYTRWMFEDGWLDLTNHLIFEAEVEFRIMYLAMLSLRRLDGATQITDQAVRSPLFYPAEDVSGSHSAVYTDAPHIKVWGDKYGGEVEILEGWDDANRESWISSGVNRNKLYFSPIGVNRSGAARSHTTSIGEVMRIRSRMRVSVI